MFKKQNKHICCGRAFCDHDFKCWSPFQLKVEPFRTGLEHSAKWGVGGVYQEKKGFAHGYCPGGAHYSSKRSFGELANWLGTTPEGVLMGPRIVPQKPQSDLRHSAGRTKSTSSYASSAGVIALFVLLMDHLSRSAADPSQRDGEQSALSSSSSSTCGLAAAIDDVLFCCADCWSGKWETHLKWENREKEKCNQLLLYVIFFITFKGLEYQHSRTKKNVKIKVEVKK